jgi:hypothetical protein
MSKISSCLKNNFNHYVEIKTFNKKALVEISKKYMNKNHKYLDVHTYEQKLEARQICFHNH